MNTIKKFTTILSLNIKRKFIYLVFFTIIVSILDLVGLSLLMPFITVAGDSNFIQDTKILKYIYDYFNFKEHMNFVFAFGILLLIFYIIRFITSMSYSYFSMRYINNMANTIMVKLFNNYMHMEYKEFTSKNTSALTKSLLSETLNVSKFVGAILKFISELFILILFVGLLSYVDWKMTLFLMAFFAILFLSLIKIIKGKAAQAGIDREKYYSGLYLHTNETFSNFLYTKLIGNEKKQLIKFEKNSVGMAGVATLSDFLTAFPRFMLEAIGIIIMVLLVLYVSYEYKDTSYILPIVGIYSIAFYRLLPSVNGILNSFLTFQYTKNAINNIYDDLQRRNEDYHGHDISFNKSIELKDISFNYGNHIIFNRYNINIKKGEKIAFTGESGSGKSTLIYIIMGILFQSSGDILVDGKKLDKDSLIQWRKKFGYIPQNIYLFDGTIAENVAYGREYDELKVIKSLKQANIYEYFLSKKGINTIVGEGGIQISGGQKQRIAIARALYDNPEILVLDEATSSLDNETENIIMDEIYKVSENKTLLIIAHRTNTLNEVDKKIVIKMASNA
jgi:ABC-type multidrug transport system fused ATPase/permease subunit